MRCMCGLWCVVYARYAVYVWCVVCVVCGVWCMRGVCSVCSRNEQQPIISQLSHTHAHAQHQFEYLALCRVELLELVGLGEIFPETYTARLLGAIRDTTTAVTNCIDIIGGSGIADAKRTSIVRFQPTFSAYIFSLHGQSTFSIYVSKSRSRNKHGRVSVPVCK